MRSALLRDRPASYRRIGSLLVLLCALAGAGLALPAVASAAAWNPQVSGTAETITDTSFADNTHGWAVGFNGALLATGDGGSFWSVQDSGTTTTIVGVACPDTTHVWWANTFIVPLGGGSYLKTSWIYATANGGGTWAKQTTVSSKLLGDIAFADATHGWAVGESGTILGTTNGGTTWTAQPSATSVAVTGVTFSDASHAWAVGTGGTIVATTNGGTSWAAQTSGTTESLTAIDAGDALHAWAVGTNGTILTTTDGGTTWVKRTSGISGTLTGVAAGDARHAWAVGGSGVILATIDGGATWRTQSSGTTQGFRSIEFTDATHGWAAGNNGTILATTTGGRDTTALVLRSSVPNGGSIRLGRSLWLSGVANPASLQGAKVLVRVQRKKSTRWVTVKRTSATIGTGGAYSRGYRPGVEGAYRLRASVTATAAYTATTTPWRTFKVR